MQPNKQMIIDYMPKVKDFMAATMLQSLLNDVKRLENQLGQQEARMIDFHANLQKYSANVIKQIIPLENDSNQAQAGFESE